MISVSQLNFSKNNFREGREAVKRNRGNGLWRDCGGLCCMGGGMCCQWGGVCGCVSTRITSERFVFGNRSEMSGFYHAGFRPVPFLHLNP